MALVGVPYGEGVGFMGDADVQQAITIDVVLRYMLDVRAIYTGYIEMGGMGTESEVLRYLAGVLPLPELQRDLVAYAVNDQLNHQYPRANRDGMVRAPYSSGKIAVAGGYAVGEFDGERLAEHRQPRERHSFSRYSSDGHSSNGVAWCPKEVEAERLTSLQASGLLDAPVRGRLERLPEITRAYFDVKGAAFTVITEDELVTKSSSGIRKMVLPREGTFCHQTIRHDRTLIIPDTHEDRFFKDSHFVTGSPFIRFYAGHPIQGPGGMRVGALCMIDDKPRTLTTKDQHKLRTLAALVQIEIWSPSA